MDAFRIGVSAIKHIAEILGKYIWICDEVVDLLLGEAGLAAPINLVVATRLLAPAAEQQNWGTKKALEIFTSRLGLVTRRLARTPFLAGDRFTAADISVTYALQLAQRTGCFALGEPEQAYVARTTARDAYDRAMETCQATRAWVAGVARSTALVP